MMEKYLFRGCTLDGKHWEYGSLIEWTEGDGTRRTFIAYQGLAPIEVIPESVGIYTGLNTQDGEKVFENDIVLIPQKEWLNGEIKGVVLYDNGGFVVRNIMSGTDNDLAWSLRPRMKGEPFTRVLGNTTFHPELLEGSVL